LSIG
jgi:hypothetical protein